LSQKAWIFTTLGFYDEANPQRGLGRLIGVAPTLRDPRGRTSL
jgi:hypothetical protein